MGVRLGQFGKVCPGLKLVQKIPRQGQGLLLGISREIGDHEPGWLDIDETKGHCGLDHKKLILHLLIVGYQLSVADWAVTGYLAMHVVLTQEIAFVELFELRARHVELLQGSIRIGLVAIVCHCNELAPFLLSHLLQVRIDLIATCLCLGLLIQDDVGNLSV